MTYISSHALRHTLFILFFLFALVLNAQNNIQWSELQEQKHKIFLDLQWLGQSSSKQNQLWLKSDREGYSIEEIDNGLTTPHLYPLSLDSIFPGSKIKSTRCYPLSFRGDTIRLLTAYTPFGRHKIFGLAAFNSKGKLVDSPTKIFESESTDYTKLSVSSDSSRFTLVQISRSDEEQKFRFKTYTRAFQLIRDYSTTLPLPAGYRKQGVVVTAFDADTFGNFIVERDLYAGGSDISDKTFWLINPDENKFKEITPHLGNATIESAVITNTAYGTRISGMYFLNDTVPDPKTPSRIFYLEVDDQNMAGVNMQTYPCSLIPLTDAKNDQIFTVDYSYSSPKLDGGHFLFIERLVVGKKSGNRYSPAFGVANFDKTGKEIYFKVIERRQRYGFGPYANAYASLPVYDSAAHILYVIFNDHENNLSGSQLIEGLRNMKNSTPVICSIDENGKMTKRRIASRDKESPVVSIAWSHKVSQNKMIMVGLEKKGYRMGWLTLDGIKGKTVAHKAGTPEVRTEPRRQTYGSKITSSNFPKTVDRRFEGVLLASFGATSKLPQSISNCLTTSGYPTQFSSQGYDTRVIGLIRSKTINWGFEAGQRSFFDKENYYETYGGFTLWKSSYIEPISSQCIFSLTLGVETQEITFTQAPLPNNRSSLGDFQLRSMCYYIGPSMKLLKLVHSWYTTHDARGTYRSSWATGLDAGLKIYVWPRPWTMTDTIVGAGNYFPGLGSMPRPSGVSFYVNIPIGLISELFGGR